MIELGEQGQCHLLPYAVWDLGQELAADWILKHEIFTYQAGSSKECEGSQHDALFEKKRGS